MSEKQELYGSADKEKIVMTDSIKKRNALGVLIDKLRHGQNLRDVMDDDMIARAILFSPAIREFFIEELTPEIRAAALLEQDKLTRHACAEAVAKLSADVAAANTYRGRVSNFAVECCHQLDRAAALCMNVEAVEK